MNIRKDDKVVVISGKDKGKQGKVLVADPKAGKVVVEGVSIATKHQKPRKAGDPSGIIEAEGALYASKVQVVCPACKKPTRVAHKKVAGDNGKMRSVRICKECGEEL